MGKQFNPKNEKQLKRISSYVDAKALSGQSNKNALGDFLYFTCILKKYDYKKACYEEFLRKTK